MVKRAGGSLLLSVAIDPRSQRPVSTQLYVILRDMILSAAFSAGDRLPASRTLARDLGLSRTTVIEAFDRLTAEGLVESRTGSGTYVSVALRAERPRPAAANERAAAAIAPRLSVVMGEAVARFGDRQRLPHAPRAFTTALPAFDAFPMA
jgi:GntR family transcriptional regulator/MocR family aminotransferase